MVDLARWLGQQLDTDERIARAVHGPVDGPLGKKWWTPEEVKSRLCDDQIHMSDAQHIAVWDPARVLREIDTKRMIVAAHERRPMSKGDSADCAHCWGAVWPCPTLRILASVYDDREGYRPEWAL